MRDADRKSVNARILFIGCLFSLFLLVVGARAVYLQIFRGPWLSEAAAKQYEKSYTTREKRGSIYDSRHREMAVSIDVTSIGAFPPKIEGPDETAQSLGRIFGIEQGKLSEQFASDRRFVWVKRQVTPREAGAVRDLELGGVAFVTEHSRYYPNRTLAAQLLGFTGVDGYGLEGIEFYYNTYLKGASGSFRIARDALGRGFDPEGNGLPGVSGKNLILTLDQTVQYIAERALEAGVQAHAAKSGIAVVLVPTTGAVLALANYPLFNPNSFGRYHRSLWRNRAITDCFEPGSTLKIFTVSAAIESARMGPGTILFAENGEYAVGDNIIHDSRPYGSISLEQVLKFSSNIGAVKISERIGPESLYRTLKAFGFGGKIGIDCPGETKGSLSSYRRWSEMDASTISFGQGVCVSAIQLAAATAAIAGDGVLMRPYVVQAITDGNGGLVQSFGPCRIRQVVSPKTARLVREMMRAAVESGGTGVNAALDGYSVCGKTGTAQKIGEDGTYAEDRFIASFVGFTPAERPEVAIVVIIDEPDEDHYGGTVAAPVFRKIALDTLHYMNIPPGSHTGRPTVLRGSEASG